MAVSTPAYFCPSRQHGTLDLDPDGGVGIVRFRSELRSRYPYKDTDMQHLGKDRFSQISSLCLEQEISLKVELNTAVLFSR